SGGTTGNRLLGLLEGHLDAADEVGGQVVDHGPDRGQGGDEQDVQRADQDGVAEDAEEGEPASGVHGPGRLALLPGEAVDRVAERVEHAQGGQDRVQDDDGDQEDDEADDRHD